MSSAESWAALLVAMPMLAEANSRWPATENGAANRVVDAGGDAHRVARLGEVRQHHRALVAPERREGDVGRAAPSPAVGRPDAGDEIALAQAPRDAAQRLAQQQVAGVVAELLVEGAKSIEVHEQQREPRRRIAPRRLHQRRDVRPQGVDAGQPGERIAGVALGDVGQGAGEQRRAAGGVALGRRRPRSPSGTRRCGSAPGARSANCGVSPVMWRSSDDISVATSSGWTRPSQAWSDRTSSTGGSPRIACHPAE